jgi:hypothetical protein
MTIDFIILVTTIVTVVAIVLWDMYNQDKK